MPPVCGALELDDKSVCRQPFLIFTETEDSGIAVSELSPLTLNESCLAMHGWSCYRLLFLSGGIKLFFI